MLSNSSSIVPTRRSVLRQFWTGLQIWYGRNRRKKARSVRPAPDNRVNGFACDTAYCVRLLEVYNRMRDDSQSNPPGPLALLSHVPEWTELLSKQAGLPKGQFTLAMLLRMPRLQAALANCTSYTPSKWLLEQELAQRFSNKSMASLPSDSLRDGQALIQRYSDLKNRERSWNRRSSEDIFEVAAEEHLAGIGLSGGGIRSATFSLGILQTLAAHNLLGCFDYISSVSGGSYIHQWLAAWIRREPRGVAAVQKKLVPLPSQGSLARTPEQINWLRRYSSYLTPRRGILTADTWTMVATWFRNTFLNQIVLFSFLAVSVVILRALMHPFDLPSREQLEHANAITKLVADRWQEFFFALLVVGGLTALRGASVFANALASQTAETPGGGLPPEGAVGDIGVVGWILIPGFLLAILTALSTVRIFNFSGMAWVWGTYVIGLLIAQTFGGHAIDTARQNRPWGPTPVRVLGFWVSILLCALLPIAAAVYSTTKGYRGWTVERVATRLADEGDRLLTKYPTDATTKTSLSTAARGICSASASCKPEQKPEEVSNLLSNRHVPRFAFVALFLPLIFFAAQFMAVRMNLGLIGRSYAESRREWLARYGAWAAIISFCWLAIGFIALVGPQLYYWVFDSGHTRRFMSLGAVGLLHVVTLYSGSSSKTSGTPDPRKFLGYSVLDLVGIIGAPLAILSLLIITSGLVDIATNSAFLHMRVAWFSNMSEHYIALHPMYALWRYLCEVSGPILLFVFYVTILVLFGWRVDVNEFSMHPFYRDRLARCYIGASNGRRLADPFTGFDDHTEASVSTGIRLAELLPARFGGKSVTKRATGGSDVVETAPYDGPMPIFCSTVTLTFGQDLAFQDRKGTSFAFTPLYCGYHITSTAETETARVTTYNGFVPTVDYGFRRPPTGGQYESGVPLSTVCAISGAALSPNQGYSSQPALAFLMTLFNVRLSWWIANPRKPWIWPKELDRPSPRFGLRSLLSELFGYSDDTSNYVNLCDGGRFDNMGLYELVRRRCRLIVICDGEEDEKTTFEGMGLAIAKARIDFGVEIEFPPEQIQALTPDKDSTRSSAHFAVGTIRYPAPPGGDPTGVRYAGKIVYLKTAYVGDEPVDLRHYKRDHPDFPQESTLNQWFTEPQFESYRRLGQLTAEQAISEIAVQHV